MITTYSNIGFDLQNPRPDQILIQDIAHALANLCRFGGHCRHFYSVATHSVYVSLQAERLGANNNGQLMGLLHDAAEAYLGDVVSPLKRRLPDYRKLESELQEKIYRRFGVTMTLANKMLVGKADKQLCRAEQSQLMPPNPPFDWHHEHPPADFRIESGYPGSAKELFLARYTHLTGAKIS